MTIPGGDQIKRRAGPGGAGAVDFHTHAFPDKLAGRAIATLEKEGGIAARLDGRVSSLLASMDRCGIEKSVVCSVATKPGQFEAILEWCGEIASGRIIPFPSIHPADPDAPAKVSRVGERGFRGIKIHPYYQDFDLDEARCFPFYEAVERAGLMLATHAGFDFAFPFTRRADPVRVLGLTRRFPGLKIIVTHLGGWRDWDEVEKHLVGRDIYLETSFSLQYLDRPAARRMINAHPADRLLFGTDSPWADQGESLALLEALALEGGRREKILRENALALLA